MTIYPIQYESIPVNAHSITASSGQEGMGKTTFQQIDGPSVNDSLFRNNHELAELQKINDCLNAIAQRLQNHDRILNQVEDYIDRMKVQLERILKNFPPFPPGSEDRIQALRSYIAFRKLIDQLTIPPPREDSAMEAETSGIPSPTESIPIVNQAGEMKPGSLEA